MVDSKQKIGPPAFEPGSFCAECGLRLQAHERFCLECGTENAPLVAPPPTPEPLPPIGLAKLYITLIMSVVAMIGSIGPWATILGISINGTRGDGQVTLGFGLIGMLTSLLALNTPRKRWMSITAACALGCAGAVAGYDLLAIHRVGDAKILGIDVATPEWGIYLAALGGVIGAFAALMHALDA